MLAVRRVHLIHRQLHFKRASHRALRVIVPHDRRAENRQNRVTDKFVNRAVVFEDDFRHALQIHVEHADDAFRRQPFPNRRKAAQIRHQNRHDALFAAEFQAVGRFQNRVNDVVREIASERFADKTVRPRQLLIRFIPFQQVDVAFGMVADAR